jgi:hypothetical protein
MQEVKPMPSLARGRGGVRHYAGEPRDVREREMLRDAVIGCTRALAEWRAR